MKYINDCELETEAQIMQRTQTTSHKSGRVVEKQNIAWQIGVNRGSICGASMLRGVLHCSKTKKNKTSKKSEQRIEVC